MPSNQRLPSWLRAAYKCGNVDKEERVDYGAQRRVNISKRVLILSNNMAEVALESRTADKSHTITWLNLNVNRSLAMYATQLLLYNVPKFHSSPSVSQSTRICGMSTTAASTGTDAVMPQKYPLLIRHVQLVWRCRNVELEAAVSTTTSVALVLPDDREELLCAAMRRACLRVRSLSSSRSDPIRHAPGPSSYGVPMYRNYIYTTACYAKAQHHGTETVYFLLYVLSTHGDGDGDGRVEGSIAGPTSSQESRRG
eukprot:6197022-Pleurochrysis_carterae.AAC.3